MSPGESFNPYRMFQGSRIPDWLERRKELTGDHKLIYARLLRYAGREGVAYPERGTLAAEVGLPVRSLQRYLSDLERIGLLRKERTGRATRYHFLWHGWMAEPVPSKPRSAKMADRRCAKMADLPAAAVPDLAVPMGQEHPSDGPTWPITSLHEAYQGKESRKCGNARAPGHDSPGDVPFPEDPGPEPPPRTGPKAKLGLDDALFGYYGRCPRSDELAEVLSTFERYERAGRRITPEETAQAVQEARRWWAANRTGNPRGTGAFLSALADIVNPVVRTSPPPEGRPPERAVDWQRLSPVEQAARSLAVLQARREAGVG